MLKIITAIMWLLLATWALTFGQTPGAPPSPVGIHVDQPFDGQLQTITDPTRPSVLPLVTWDNKDRRLVITEWMPRDALVCVRDICELPDTWRRLHQQVGGK